MNSSLRIIDANANRSREALRVMEEAARFHLENEKLTSLIKQLRHDLAASLTRFDTLEFHRDTQEDVGTNLSTASEYTRTSIAEVAIAAGKRLSEGLRAIEEYTKTVDAEIAQSVEQLRYRGYELEKQLNTRMSTSLVKQWRLCVILSTHLCKDRSIEETARISVEAGADCIQLREKNIDDKVLLDRAIGVKEAIAKRATFILNDRPDIALLAGADGVHLGQNDLPCKKVRELSERRLFIGVSTSSMQEAKLAFEDGADYCGVGPMFPTTTKNKDIIVGPDYLREYLKWNKLPHLAIGGITISNIGNLMEIGCGGVAVSSAVCSANEPGCGVDGLISKMQIKRTKSIGV